MEPDRAIAQTVINHIDAHMNAIHDILADVRLGYVSDKPYPINDPNTCEICHLITQCGVVGSMFLCRGCTFNTRPKILKYNPEVNNPVTVERVRKLHEGIPQLDAIAIAALACARMTKLANVGRTEYNRSCAICRRFDRTVMLIRYTLEGTWHMCSRSICDECHNGVNEKIKQIRERAVNLLCACKQLRLGDAKTHVLEYTGMIIISEIYTQMA